MRKNIRATACQEPESILVQQRGYDQSSGWNDLKIGKRETVGLIGQTAAGKTVKALSILGILQPLGKGKPL